MVNYLNAEDFGPFEGDLVCEIAWYLVLVFQAPGFLPWGLELGE